MEMKSGEERKRGGRKAGRPSKAELFGRERSWSVGSGKSIDKFFKKKRDEKES